MLIWAFLEWKRDDIMTEQQLIDHFLERFDVISEHDAEQLWNDGNRNFLVLAKDGTDRYADCFATWEELKETYPDALFGTER